MQLTGRYSALGINIGTDYTQTKKWHRTSVSFAEKFVFVSNFIADPNNYSVKIVIPAWS